MATEAREGEELDRELESMENIGRKTTNVAPIHGKIDRITSRIVDEFPPDTR